MNALELKAMLQFKTFRLKNTTTHYVFTLDEVVKNDKSIGHYKLLDTLNELQIELSLDGFESVIFDLKTDLDPLVISFISQGNNVPFMVLEKSDAFS